MTRRIELIAGLMAGGLGIIGLGVGTFAETKTSIVIGNGVTWMDRTVWWGHGFDSQMIVYLCIMAAALISVIGGTVVHQMQGVTIGLIALWIGGLVLLAGGLLDMPTWSTTISASGVTTWNDTGIGVWLIPSALLALLAALAGTGASVRRSPTYGAMHPSP